MAVDDGWMGLEDSLEWGEIEEAAAVHFSRVQSSSSRFASSTQAGTMWIPNFLKKVTTPGSSPAQKR